MTIYIACHKKYPQLTFDPVYTPLHVGKSLSSLELGFIGDNTGNHISEKNLNYSELTGLYWIWENTDSEVVGLCHYRRFFFSKKPTKRMQFKKVIEKLIRLGKKRHGIYYSSSQKDKQLILNSDETFQIIENYDAIVPMGRKIRYSVWEHYKKRHFIKDMETTQEIITEIYPSYLDAFSEVMKKKELYPCNMFVMKRKCYDEYMKWLFTILFELEKRIDISNYDNYQKRVFGFISERLLDVWLTKQNLKFKSLPILYFWKLKS